MEEDAAGGGRGIAATVVGVCCCDKGGIGGRASGIDASCFGVLASATRDRALVTGLKTVLPFSI